MKEKKITGECFWRNDCWYLIPTILVSNYINVLDLIFSFFSKHFNIKLTVRIMPVLTSLGWIIYAAIPMIFPEYAYAGFVAGTILFSVSAGLSEVLTSPLIAAMPSEHPDKDMSFLHSLYAWGVLINVVISSLFLWIFGNENWMYLALLLAAISGNLTHPP